MRSLLSFTCIILGLAAHTGCASPAVGSSSFELHGDDFDRLRGTYTLADRRIVQLAGTRWHPRLEFDDDTALPLHALSATEFVSGDGCLRVVFEAHANATVIRLRMIYLHACTGHRD